MRSSNDSRRGNTGTDRGHVRRVKRSIADADQRSGAKRSKCDGKTPLDQIAHPHQILSRSSNALENVWSNVWPATDQQCQNISQGNNALDNVWAATSQPGQNNNALDNVWNDVWAATYQPLMNRNYTNAAPVSAPQGVI